jgi:ankyrin repeat protein
VLAEWREADHTPVSPVMTQKRLYHFIMLLCSFLKIVEHLITANFWDINSRGCFYSTPLHTASVKGHLNITSLLSENAADPNSQDYLGRAPLYRVSQGGQLVIQELSYAVNSSPITNTW